MKKTIFILILALLATVGLVKAIDMQLTVGELKELLNGEQIEISMHGELSGIAGVPLDVIGTRSASSSTLGYFNVGDVDIGMSGSTTYPIFIGRDIDEAVFTIVAENASSTSIGTVFNFSVLQSDDDDCWTATTSTSMTNRMLKSEIRWTDASRHINNFAGALSMTGTTTIPWEPVVEGTGRELTLTNLNTNCLALEAAGSSTAVWARVATKLR